MNCQLSIADCRLIRTTTGMERAIRAGSGSDRTRPNPKRKRGVNVRHSWWVLCRVTGSAPPSARRAWRAADARSALRYRDSLPSSAPVMRSNIAVTLARHSSRNTIFSSKSPSTAPLPGRAGFVLTSSAGMTSKR